MYQTEFSWLSKFILSYFFITILVLFSLICYFFSITISPLRYFHQLRNISMFTYTFTLSLYYKVLTAKSTFKKKMKRKEEKKRNLIKQFRFYEFIVLDIKQSSDMLFLIIYNYQHFSNFKNSTRINWVDNIFLNISIFQSTIYSWSLHQEMF